MMKIKTKQQQIDLKAPKLNNTSHVKKPCKIAETLQKRHQPSERFFTCRDRKDIAFSIYYLMSVKIKVNIAVDNVKEILSSNISKMKKIQSKSMFVMSTEAMFKITSIFRNIKMGASRNKLNYQYFWKTRSLCYSPISKYQIAAIRSAFQQTNIQSVFGFAWKSREC